MKRNVKLEVTVAVLYDTPLDLRMALAHLRREGPSDATVAGHCAGFRNGWAKPGHSYSYALRTRKGAKVKP